MADIKVDVKLVKELRQRTGLGISECKKALTEAEGDINSAVEILKSYGAKVAGKKSDREANEGIAKVFANDSACYTIEVNCETDFVALNDNFISLVERVGKAALVSGAETIEKLNKVEESGVTVAEFMLEAVGQMKENIGISKYTKINLDANDVVGSYIHMGGKVAVATILSTEGSKNAKVAELAKDISVHISAMPVEFISEDEVTEEKLEEVKVEILKNEALFEGKPDKVKDIILNNKVKDFVNDNCLLKHDFVKDTDLTIEQLVAKVSKEVGETISIKNYTKFILGE